MTVADDLRAARALIEDPKQPGVVIKPLVWERTEPTGKMVATTIIGRYECWGVNWMLGKRMIEQADSHEEALAAAQADYERIIRSAILDAPDHTALLREAITALADAGTQLTQAGNVAYNMKQTTSTVESAREFARISAWVDGAKETIRGAIQSLKTAIGDANG